MNEVIDYLKDAVLYLGPIFGILVIILESIFPILPLALFISLNLLVFGNLFGFIISFIGTILGCLLSYYAFKNGFNKYLYRHIKLDGKVDYFLKTIKKLSFSKLVVLIAIPFTPAFAVNIAAGLSKMSTKKFVLAILIGKISIVFFWGFIGKTFLESINNPLTLVVILIVLVFTYLISELIEKLLDIKE